MQSAHFRNGNDLPPPGRLHWPGVGAIHVQGQMRPPAMVIAKVSGEEAPQVVLAEDDQLIQTLPPNAPDDALRIGILPRTPRRSEHLRHAQAGEAPLKDVAIHRIAVPEEIPGRRVPWEGLNQLSPGTARTRPVTREVNSSTCATCAPGRSGPRPSTSSTSSNVNPSRIGPSIYFSLNDKKTAPIYNTAQRKAAGRSIRQHSRNLSFIGEFSFYAARCAKASARPVPACTGKSGFCRKMMFE